MIKSVVVIYLTVLVHMTTGQNVGIELGNAPKVQNIDTAVNRVQNLRARVHKLREDLDKIVREG